MKLQDNLPKGVTVDGKFYKLDFDFRNVLRMMDVLGSKDLMPAAKAYNAVHCLTKRPKNVFKVLNAVQQLLFDQRPQKDAQKVTDFVQDAGMIRAAFLQVYGINLYRDKLHWIEFKELLNAIPEGSRYAEVVGIRSRPLPAPTKYNNAERQWLMKAKADVALEITEEEREKKYSDDAARVFGGLLSMINKGSGNNGE